MPSRKKRSQRATQTRLLRERSALLEVRLERPDDLPVGFQSLDGFFRQYFNSGRVAVVLFSDDLRSATFVSGSTPRMLGCTPEELKADARAWMQAIRSEDLAKVEDAVAGAAAGESTEVTYRVDCDGASAWIRLRFAISADGVKPHTVAGLFSDITDIKLSEAALRRSEERFRALAVHSPTGIFQYDLTGHALFVNDRYRTITGISQGDDGRFGWLRTLHPDDRARVLAAGREAIKSRTEFSQEYRFLHDDGTLRWVLGSAVPLYGDMGQVTSYLGNVLDISDRKAVEESLRIGNERFRLLSENVPIGIFMSEEAGNLVYVNPRAETIYGYPSQELLGLGFARVYDFDERQAHLSNWLRIAATTDEHDVERTIINAWGVRRCVRVRSAPMTSPTGSVVGRIGMVEDITDRRRGEYELRDSEERYRLLAEHATDMISKHSYDGVFVYASPACRALLGYEPEELIDKTWLDFVHRDDREAIVASPAAVPGPMETASFTYRARRKDGETIWLETVWKSIPDPAGDDAQAQGELVAVTRDITSRRAAVEQLQASEARLRAILETAADGIVTVDESGTIERFNPGAERLFGYRADEVLGQNIRLLIPDEKDAVAEGRARRVAAFRRPLARVRELVGRHKDGTTRDLEMRVGETLVAGRKTFTGILHDVSHRKHTERMLRETEKLAATGRIAARIAHEINNPLAGVKNSFLLVKEAIPQDHKYFDYVERIELEIDRIARIVRQLFDLHRPTQLTHGEIELSDTICEVVTLLDSVAGTREVTTEVDTTRAAGTVRLSADSFRQVLWNVVVNAIEASPRGGVVRIEAQSGGGVVDVFIRDQGPGIPPETRLRIFEPFFTTKSKHSNGGLGLGLSIVRGLVEAMRGTLAFNSTRETGTTFHICLPTSSQEGTSSHGSTTSNTFRR